MITDIQATIAEIQVLLDKRNTQPAFMRILSIIKHDRFFLNVKDLSALYHLWARCEYLNGNFRKALIKEMVSERLCFDPSELISYGLQKNLKGLILMSLGRLDEAIEEFMEAFAARRKSKQNDRVWAPLLNLGLANFVKGNLHQTLDSSKSAASYATKFNSVTELVTCRVMEARACLWSGRFSETYRVIDWLLEKSESQAHRNDALCLTAILDTFLVECKKARLDLGKVKNDYAEAGYKRGVAVCLEYLGLNEYFAGNYAKAREYYDQVLAMPEPTASAVAQTLRMLTDVEIAEGNWEAAKTTAAKADVAINKISERIELGALWRAYGHIHTHDNEHAKAREYFEKSIDLLRQLGARYELALSHFDAGLSKAYSQEQRIEHLKAAKALFVEMEVPKRVAQVDEALGELAAADTSSAQNGRRKLTIKAKAVQVPEIVAESEAMKRIVALADRIKDNEMNILITGETGTGKDLLAEYIHKSSLRVDKPFVVVNCAAIPESMLEAELFGYRKGSYTGATTDKPGLIETADGGSFFLNEIGEASVSIQRKLLQVIEEKSVRRLGDNASIKIDVRFIAATNQNLKEQIAKGEFRSDLFYRLNEMPICIPPLRERAEDAIALLEMLFANHGIVLNGDFDSVENSVKFYTWPGNVRELIAIANRVASIHRTGNDNLTELLNSELDMGSPDSEERHRLLQAVAKHGGNKTRAAIELGIPVSTLRSRLEKFNL